ncbi:hypothetical protein B0H63DRAFT_565128 [Podospora didyma]|uniref:Monooxygenase n=1 Tax=Podospora didyma TaxID=330526 RepID=A0AAE0K1Q5_9PEZI|nr:hypothetical protein B0H63DRAFT_565128 [Podospora didyma]
MHPMTRSPTLKRSLAADPTSWNDACNIAAKDGGILFDKDAGALHVAVERVDGTGGVADSQLVGSGGGHGCISDLKGSSGFVEQSGLEVEATIDILIIGAGPTGLCAAKTILQHDANADLVLIDGRATVGGVWAIEQLYPNLRTNNLFTSMDFSDLPMETARFGVCDGQHISGEQMHAYLNAYAEHFDVSRRIRFNAKATKISRRDSEGEGKGGWDVELDSGEILSCRKLIAATGVLNKPKLPHLEGQDEFDGTIQHTNELRLRPELGVLVTHAARPDPSMARAPHHAAYPDLHLPSPKLNPFWYGTSSGVLNYGTDFLALLKSGQVRVRRADISHLSNHTVHLVDEPTSSGPAKLAVDAIITATGYSSQRALTFSPSSLAADLGIPTTSPSSESIALWSRFNAVADSHITALFPSLISPAAVHTPAKLDKTTPWRLYRGIAPPGLAAAGDRSLVFLGMFSNIANITRIEMQCLWALAYLTGAKLAHLHASDKEGVFCEAATLQRWAQYRAPRGHGASYPDLVFDQLPYCDVLLHDLGLATRGKKGALRELLEPYSPVGYKGVVEECLGKEKNGREVK